jgi:hypothetical protein
MSKKRDQSIKKQRDSYKVTALHLAKLWAKKRLKEYKEPERRGTAKGDPIGFSKKKYHAALLMTLYPQIFGLKDIAREVKASYGMLRLWRTEDQFKKAVENGCRDFAEFLTHGVENLADEFSLSLLGKWQGEKAEEDNLVDYLGGIVCILPYLNFLVSEPVIGFLGHRIHDEKADDAHGLLYSSLGYLLLKRVNISDSKTLREWQSRPEVLELIKGEIDAMIDLLVKASNPKSKANPKEVHQLGERLKETINYNLDVLAGR